MGDLLTTTEAAKFLDIHPNTLRKWDKVGYFKPEPKKGLSLYRRYDIKKLEKLKKSWTVDNTN